MAKKYDDQFRKDAVNHLLISGKTVREVSKALGVSKSALHQWRKEYDTGASQQELSMADELTQLRKELRDVTMERDILKKATAIFSKMQL